MDQAALRRMAVEHSEHARQLDVLEQALFSDSPNHAAALEQLAAIDHELAGHLRREEATLLPWLSRALPERIEETELLVREHIEILATATVLRFALRAPQDPPHRAIQAVLRYTQLLRRHLCREEALVAAASLALRGS